MANIPGIRKIGLHVVIVLSFIVLSMVYFFPQLEGRVLQQSDIQHHAGMSKELVDFRKATGEEGLWTNSMFGGMPGYLVSVIYPGNLFNTVYGWFRSLFHPAAMLILYLIGFYILLLNLKVDRWLSLVGAVAFGFSSYFLIIIGAGHNTKAYAIGFLMPVIAGAVSAFRFNPWKGGLLFTIALAFEILASHLQITYYGIIILFIYFLIEFILALREKLLQNFLKTGFILLAGAILAVAVNFSSLYTTWEYSKQTIRGPSELTSNDANKTSGLDKDYVVQWSQGIDETFTLLIPNFKGGAHPQNPGINSESLKVMQKNGVQNARQYLQGIYTYRGDKIATAGPVYLGAIVIFLFVLALFLVKGPIKWWLVSATIVSVLLSWGKNIMWLTSFLLDYLPLYNKFRTPEMALVIVQVTVPLLGFIGLGKILSGEVDRKKFLNGIKWALGITGGITLLFAAIPGIAGDFRAPYDAQLQYPDWLMEGILTDRKNLLRNDAFRSFVFVVLAAAALYTWHLKKLKTNGFVLALGFLILIDLWVIDRRYLNNDNFVSKREAENPFPESAADKEILADKDLSFRVIPLQNPWQDAGTSYYHKNVGGYHPAKLRRYQEMIDHHFTSELQQMVQKLQKGSAPDSIFAELPALNMMNTRYIIYSSDQSPLRNFASIGNAWFVNDYKVVNDADEEIASLTGFDPSNLAVIDQRFSNYVEGKSFIKDSIGSIQLTEYKPNYLKYDFSAQTEQLTVFSEVYYDKGWDAYVDGKLFPHFRVNYILRAMVIPSGRHTIEFRFEPKSYYLGNKVSLAGSVLLLLIIAAYLFWEIKRSMGKQGAK